MLSVTRSKRAVHFIERRLFYERHSELTRELAYVHVHVRLCTLVSGIEGYYSYSEAYIIYSHATGPCRVSVDCVDFRDHLTVTRL